jgi:integrase
LSDLNDDTVTIWLKSLLDSGENRVNTIRERVGRILTLWTWCAKRRIVDMFPTVQRPPEQESVPHAWDEEELGRLFKSAAEEKGFIRGILAADWWVAWLAFIFNTAERLSAALALRWEWIDLKRGVVTIPAEVRKGGVKVGIYHLWPETIPLLEKIRPDNGTGLVFPQDSPTMYHRYFGQILARAGLPSDRKCKTHCLRATHATIRTVLGGDAAKALLHSDPVTTRKHYIDPRHLPPDSVKMPVPWVDGQTQPKALPGPGNPEEDEGTSPVSPPAPKPKAGPSNHAAVIAMEASDAELRALPRARRIAG